MISEVSFKNFKALRDVSTSLERLTVFVGPNASGKSSLLEGIHYLAQVSQHNPETVFIGPPAPELLRGGDSDGKMEFYCRIGNVHLTLQIWSGSSLPETVRRRLHRDPRRGSVLQPAGGVEWGYERLVRSPFDNEPLPLEAADETTRSLIQGCGKAVLLKLEPSRLAAPSYVYPGVAPGVESDGDGLATALLYLKGNCENEFAQVQSELHELVPAVRGLHFDKATVYKTEPEYHERDGTRTQTQTPRAYNGDALRFDTSSGSNIPARLMSEGTLMLLGILTVLHSPTRPQIVLIDDIDKALHAKAQKMLVGLLHQLLDRHEDLQIAATTHSPYLLDGLEPEEVRLTTLDENGDVVCAPLTEHPDFPKWKDEMTPGEFWSAVGEDWVREQAKAGAAS